MKLLETLAKLCAILAGLLMVTITVIVCGAVFSRALFSKPLLGDFELVELTMAVAVAAFMPYCQIRRGHIIVDFFTQRASQGVRDLLDRLGLVTIGVLLALVAWRTALGGLSSQKSQTVTMLLQFPEWTAYMAMVPPLALAAVIAFVQGLRPGPLAKAYSDGDEEIQRAERELAQRLHGSSAPTGAQP
jgi:TRAP-type C4-dicarboxylate transport system permease small subunit